MSCNWDVHCLDCNEDAGMSVNHGDGTMRRLVDNRERIEPLGDLLSAEGIWSLGLTVNGEDVIVNFFAEHRGHRLVPQNEYGEFDTPCGKSFNCPICGPVVCSRLDHSVAHQPLHYHSTEDHRIHWEKEKG